MWMTDPVGMSTMLLLLFWAAIGVDELSVFSTLSGVAVGLSTVTGAERLGVVLRSCSRLWLVQAAPPLYLSGILKSSIISWQDAHSVDGGDKKIAQFKWQRFITLGDGDSALLVKCLGLLWKCSQNEVATCCKQEGPLSLSLLHYSLPLTELLNGTCAASTVLYTSVYWKRFPNKMSKMVLILKEVHHYAQVRFF